MVETSTPLGSVVRFEDAGDYYKLRALISDAERATAVAQMVRQQALAAIAVRDACVRQMAEKYGFDPMFTQVQQDDETQSFSFS